MYGIGDGGMLKVRTRDFGVENLGGDRMGCVDPAMTIESFQIPYDFLFYFLFSA